MLGILKKVAEELEGWDFVCFHKYYLINLKFVTPLGPEFAILDNEIRLKIVRFRRKDVQSPFVDSYSKR